MSVTQCSQPRSDISGFQFKLLTRLKVFDSQDGLFKSSTNLLASASKYGLVFIGCPAGFQVIVLSSVVGSLPDNKDGNNLYHRRTIPLPSQPSHLALSCDQSHLIAAIRKSGCAHALVYNVPSFTSQNEVIVNEVRLSPSPEVFTTDLSWNPGIANMMTSCMSDGSVTVYEFQPSGVNINSIPPESRSTCVSWSPKGKQLVIGSDEGALTQYKPDMKAVKALPGPQIPGKQFSVVSVVWISSFQFGAVYRDKANPQEGQALMIVNAQKAGPSTFVNFDDACYSTGQLRPPQFYFSHIQPWNLLLVGSGNSVEIGVLGLEVNQASWVQWLFDDGARAELPLTSDTQETFLVGMAVDTSTTYKLPWGESNSETIGPMPILLMLSHYGILCVYYMVNLLQGYPAICAPPEQLSDLTGLHHFVQGGAGDNTVHHAAPLPPVPVHASTLVPQSIPSNVGQEMSHLKAATPLNLFVGATSTPGLFGAAVPQISSAAPTSFFANASPVMVPMTTSNLFGGAPTAGAAPGLFGVNTQVPSLFGAPTSNQGSGGIFGAPLPSSTPSLFGAPDTIQSSTTNVFGGGGTTQTAAPNIFGGGMTGHSGAAPSIFSTPAVSSFGFGTQETTSASLPSFGAATSSLGIGTGAGARFVSAVPAATVSPQISVESKPQGTTFGSGVGVVGGGGSFSFTQPAQEQPKSLFTLPTPVTQIEGQATQIVAAAAAGDHGYIKQQEAANSTQVVLHPSSESSGQGQPAEQYQVSAGFGSQQQQPSVPPIAQIQPSRLVASEGSQKLKSAPSPTPAVVEKAVKEEVEEIDSSVFIAAIAEEMNHFEAGLAELKKRVGKINIQIIGTEEEKRSLSCNVDSMSEFVRDLKETTQCQVKEINALRTVTFEALAWLEEARSRQQQLKSPRFQQLQQTLDLDNSSARRLANIQHLVYYVDSQLSQVMAQLDCDWLQLQDKCKNARKNRLEPTVDAVYRTLMAQNAIVTRQRVMLLDLIKRAQPISKHKLELISNMSLLHVSDKRADSELARLADSLIQVKLGPTKREKLSSKKQEKLLTLLTDRPITRIRAVRPAICSSILDLPPIKTGGISSGTPIKSISPIQKLPEIPFQKTFVHSQVSGGSTFTFTSTVPSVKGTTSVKQPLSFSTPVIAGGQKVLQPSFGSANKTIQSIPKDLTAYYDDVTPPKSPEPEPKQGDPEIISSFSSFTFSAADKNVQKGPAKSSVGSTLSILKETPKSSTVLPKQSEELLTTTILPGVVGSESQTTTPSTFGSFSFAAPKPMSTNLFSGVKPSSSSTQSSTNMFGTFSFGSSDPAKPSIFGGSPPGGIIFGKPKDSEVQSKPVPSTTSVVTTTCTESPGENEPIDNKVVDVSNATSVSSSFSFASPAASTHAGVFGQKSGASAFSFTQIEEEEQPPTTTTSTFSFQIKDISTLSEGGKSVAEIIPISVGSEVPPTDGNSGVTSALPSSVVAPESSVASTSTLQPTSTMSAFSFAKAPTETLPPTPPSIGTETTISSTTETTTGSTFFGQPICSPISFGQSGGSLFGKPITTSTSPSIFGGSSSPKTPVLGEVIATEQSTPLTVPSNTSSTVVSDPSTPAAPAYVVIETRSPSTTSASIFGSSGIPTTTATNVFGVTITPVTSATASTPSTVTSTAPDTLEIKSPTTVTTTTTTDTTATNSVTALTSMFGATITPTTSATAGFGGQSTGGQSLFGAQNTSNSATSITPIFGTSIGVTSAVSSPSIFGQSSTVAPSVFGQAASSTGSVFGGGDSSSTTTAPTAFGTSGGSLFGSTTSNLFTTSAATSSPSVFGQSSVQTPSLFGQAPTTTQSIFGQATSATTTSSPFGSKPSIFGQAQETTASAFGAPAAFGQTPQSVFGQSTPGSFGSSGGSMFGASSSMFGSSPPTSGGLFQQPSGGFGSPGSSAGGMFSSSNAPSISQTGFGGSSIFQNKPGGFGGSPVFGGNTSFGAAPSFGGAPAFGAPPSFGSPPKVFGSSTPAANTGFGSVSPSQQSSTFENLASQNTMSFGNLAQGQTQGFGPPQQSLFGAPQQSTAQPPPAFSGGGSSFGGSSFSSWR